MTFGRITPVVLSTVASVGVWLGPIPSASAEHSHIARVSQGPTGGNSDLSYRAPDLEDVSTDGATMAFQTNEALVAQDRDATLDVYTWSEAGGLSLTSTGPVGGNAEEHADFAAMSSDGSRVWFTTRERLTADEAVSETGEDLFERGPEGTKLISTGPTDPGGGGAGFVDVSSDGSKVLFDSNVPLVAGDTDTVRDAYVREGSRTTLVSTGPTGGVVPDDPDSRPGAFGSRLAPDGSAAFFASDERFLSDDTDDVRDFYERRDGTTYQVSVGPAGGNQEHEVTGVRVSSDGSRVAFNTAEALVAEDADAERQDVYQRIDRQRTELISIGSVGGNGFYTARLASAAFDGGVSPDGLRVLFETQERLEPEDAGVDEFGFPTPDVYVRTPTGTELVTVGPKGNGVSGLNPPEHSSPDTTRVTFESTYQLVADDQDDRVDVYQWADGVTSRLSLGPTGGDGEVESHFEAASSDGSRVFFSTAEALTPEGANDRSALGLYERAGGRTYWIAPLYAVFFSGVASGGDGSKVFFATERQLTSDDCDTRADIYVASIDPVAPGSLPAETHGCDGTSGEPPPPEPPAKCAGIDATIEGSPNREVVRGTAGSDVIAALGGNDTVEGLGGNDVICGGHGRDAVNGGGGRDLLLGGADEDVGRGERGADRLRGGVAADRLEGGPGADRVGGGHGSDALFGGGAGDTIGGQRGNDLLKGNAGDDTLDGGPNRDGCHGGAGRDGEIRCER